MNKPQEIAETRTEEETRSKYNMRKRQRRSNSEEEYLKKIYADDIVTVSDEGEQNDEYKEKKPVPKRRKQTRSPKQTKSTHSPPQTVIVIDDDDVEVSPDTVNDDECFNMPTIPLHDVLVGSTHSSKIFCYSESLEEEKSEVNESDEEIINDSDDEEGVAFSYWSSTPREPISSVKKVYDSTHTSRYWSRAPVVATLDEFEEFHPRSKRTKATRKTKARKPFSTVQPTAEVPKKDTKVKKKKFSLLPAEAKNVLLKWHNNNQTTRVDTAVLQKLEEKTNLTHKQIANWIYSQRRR